MTQAATTAPETAARAGEPILEVDGLGHAYGPRQIFRGLDFSIRKGEFVCIVGPSGVGKTTLLQCLTGLQKPSQGSVNFDGTDPCYKACSVFWCLSSYPFR